MDRNEAIEVLTKMLDCEDIDFCDSDCFKCRLFTRDVDRSNALIMAIKTLDKGINVPNKSALDHIHNVVRDDAYKRGYEQGKAEEGPAIPLAWIERYMLTCNIFDLRVNGPASKVIKTMVKIWGQENQGEKRGGDNGKT